MLSIVQVIKFAESEPERTITIVDKGILDVKTGIANTEAGMTNSSGESTSTYISAVVLLPSNHSDSYQTRPSARECIRRGRKEAALNHIRSKKGLEESLRKRLPMLGTLQEMLRNIEQAADNIEVKRTILVKRKLRSDPIPSTRTDYEAVRIQHVHAPDDPYTSLPPARQSRRDRSTRWQPRRPTTARSTTQSGRVRSSHRQKRTPGSTMPSLRRSLRAWLRTRREKRV